MVIYGHGGDIVQYTLKELRARNNLTQQEIAEKLGISRQRYIEIEKKPSKVSVEKMSAIAKILKVGIGDIFLEDYHTNSKV